MFLKKLNRFILWFVFVLFLAHISKNIMKDIPKERILSFPQFIKEVKSGNIQKVAIEGNTIKGTFKKKNNKGKNLPFKTIGNTGDTTLKILYDKGITPHYEEVIDFSLYGALIMWSPVILLIIILFLILRLEKKITKPREEMGSDIDNFFKDPVEKHDGYHLYKIQLTSSERKIVEDALEKTKQTYSGQTNLTRFGEHIAHICKMFVEKK